LNSTEQESGEASTPEVQLRQLGRLRLVVAVLCLVCAAAGLQAGQLRLSKASGRHAPGGAEQASRFIRNYTKLQSDLAPFERFRFYPTDSDKRRIRRLQQGESDTVRVLCLRVEFVEDSTELTTGNGKMDTLGFLEPDSGLFYDPPHFKLYFERQMEGLRNYYLAQSLGRLVVDYTVMPEGEKESYQLPRQMQFYGDSTSWEAVEIGLVRLMRDAFKIADLDSAISFADYDEFIVFHAGSGLQADFGLRGDSPFDLLAGEIPPGALEAYLGEPFIKVDEGATRIEQGTVLPEMMRQDTMFQDQTNILGMVGLSGTLCHEFAHLLGAYDLYDVTGVTMGCGAWSLMGYGGWLGDYSAGAPPGVIPGFLDAYHRVALGLVDTVQVNVPRESIPVYAAEVDTSLFHERGDSLRPTVIAVPITADEYFLIENRQVDVRKPDTIVVDVEDGVLVGVEDNEYDFFLPGSGVLVWHIDQTVIADYGPYNAINIDAARKGVDLEEADGVQDFDVPYWESWAPDYEIYGSPNDPFRKGGYNDSFTAETDPSSDGYMGKSFMRVSLLGEEDTLDRLKDTLIYVNVGWDLYQEGFPVSYEGRSVPFLSAFAADLDGNDSLELVVLDTMGRISAWREDGTGYRYQTNGAFAELTTSSHSDVAIGDVGGDDMLEVVAGGSDGTVRLYNSDGTSRGIYRTGDRVLAAPVLADLDGDGKKDVIVGSTDMQLHAFTGDFDTLPGFPVFVGAEIRAAVAVTDTVRPDVVLLTGDGRLLLVQGDGSIAEGFPVVLSNVPYYNVSQPLVGDFDRDGDREIAVVAGSEFDNRLFIVGLDGDIEYQSTEIVRQPFAGVAAAADISADGYPDVLLASMNDLLAFNRNATLVANYPFKQESTYVTSELAGNWIIFYEAYFQYTSSPVVADLDGDSSLDIAIGSPQYGVLGVDSRHGRPVRYSPLMTTAPVSAVPLVVDLDRDGDVELVAGSEDGVFHVWDLEGASDMIAWGCAYHDPCHTGLILDSELPIMPDPPAAIVGSFFVYPNPAEDKVTVRYRLGESPVSARVLLLDMAGEPVGTPVDGPALPVTDNEFEMDLSDTDPGLYVVRLAVDDGMRTDVRFAKLAIVR